MLESVLQQYETYPDPSPAAVPIGPAQLDRRDDNLHVGWSWSRNGYAFRRLAHVRALDAGCGTGLSSLGLASLNPGASVLGVDASPRALELARERGAASGLPGVEFRPHDLDEPLPASWGPFDFIVCRRVLAQAADPARILRNLAAALDHRGLLHLTLPAHVGHTPARQMRQAVQTLCGPRATLAEKAALGLDLFRTLRPDHPIRRYEETHSGKTVPSVERFIAGYLNEAETDWTLPDAVALVESAGLRFLFAAARAPWRAERVFVAGAVSDPLVKRVNALGAQGLSLLVDALDPMLHADEYRIYACLAEYEPRVPAWVEASKTDPAAVARLIPHRTGLARPAGPVPAPLPPRVPYRIVTGAIAELAGRSHLLLEGVDDTRTCDAIESAVAAATGVAEPPAERHRRWVELADIGLILLEPPEPRQHVDCTHLGAVVDRLDCACPRRWLRACEIHRYCTLASVGPGDEKFAAVQEGLRRLNVNHAAACATCPDYSPED